MKAMAFAPEKLKKSLTTLVVEKAVHTEYNDFDKEAKISRVKLHEPQAMLDTFKHSKIFPYLYKR